LPLISEAFGSGRISYSKARALTRVANEHNEQSLLDIAMAGTATHVERIVRHYRQMQATDCPEAIFDRRSLTCYWDDDGTLVFRGRLTAEQGAVLMKALEHARERPDEHNSFDCFETNGADALVSISERYLAGDGSDNNSQGSRTADRFQVKVTASVASLGKITKTAGAGGKDWRRRDQHRSRWRCIRCSNGSVTVSDPCVGRRPSAINSYGAPSALRRHHHPDPGR